MILFREEFIEKILSGQKTQTRRMWKKPRIKVGTLHWAQTHMIWKGGRFARIKIDNVQEWDESTISKEDLRAEGFELEKDFWDLWYKMHEGRSKFYKGFVVHFHVVERTIHLPMYSTMSNEATRYAKYIMACLYNGYPINVSCRYCKQINEPFMQNLIEPIMQFYHPNIDFIKDHLLFDTKSEEGLTHEYIYGLIDRCMNA